MGLTQRLGLLADVFQPDSSLNVGIGGAANASYKLTVTGTTLTTGAATFSSSVTATQFNASSKYAWGTATNGTTGQIATDNTNNYFDYLGNLYFRGAAASNTLITFTSAGAATFSSSVTAAGDIIAVAGVGIVSGGGGYAIGPTSTRGIIAINGSVDQILTFSSQSYIYNSSSLFRLLSSNDLDFAIGGTQRMIIKAATGNVGIGTSSPTYKLDVNGVTQIRDTLLVTKQNGYFYAQTSSSGTTSYVDTGIYYNTSIIGFSNNSIYQITVVGNPNGAGSSEYRAVYLGYIYVTTGYDFGIGNVVQNIGYTQTVTGTPLNIGSLSISVVFWNGSTESTQQVNGTTNNQIRVKISNYNSGNIGAAQEVRIFRIIS